MLDAFGVFIRVEPSVGGFQPFRSEPFPNFEAIAEDVLSEFVPYLRALRIFVVTSDLSGRMSPDSGKKVAGRPDEGFSRMGTCKKDLLTQRR